MRNPRGITELTPLADGSIRVQSCVGKSLFLREENIQDIITSERYECRWRCTECGCIQTCMRYSELDKAPQTVYSDREAIFQQRV